MIAFASRRQAFDAGDQAAKGVAIVEAVFELDPGPQFEKVINQRWISAGQNDRYHSEAWFPRLAIECPLNFLAEPSGGSLVADAHCARTGLLKCLCQVMLPQLSGNQGPLIEPDTKSAIVFETGAE